jgi:hypothetical protein
MEEASSNTISTYWFVAETVTSLEVSWACYIGGKSLYESRWITTSYRVIYEITLLNKCHVVMSEHPQHDAWKMDALVLAIGLDEKRERLRIRGSSQCSLRSHRGDNLAEEARQGRRQRCIHWRYDCWDMTVGVIMWERRGGEWNGVPSIGVIAATSPAHLHAYNRCSFQQQACFKTYVGHNIEEALVSKWTKIFSTRPS